MGLRPVDPDEDSCVSEDLTPPKEGPEALHYELALSAAWANARHAERDARRAGQPEAAKTCKAVADALADVSRRARELHG